MVDVRPHCLGPSARQAVLSVDDRAEIRRLHSQKEWGSRRSQERLGSSSVLRLHTRLGWSLRTASLFHLSEIPPHCPLRSRHLPPFAMWTAFPSSDYYGGSVAIGLSPRRRSRIPCALDVYSLT
jgi:hypothetical protein